MSRWSRYWFAPGGRISAAALRIGIALAVFGTLHHLAHHSGWMMGTRALYRPVGVWMLLGRVQPPAPVVAALWVLALGGTAAMLVGAWTRAATAISFGASVALAALSFAQTATWSHQYNVVFLAQCAFLGARGGDAWSIDAWRRPVTGAHAYRWSVRLVQLAVALMFASAAFHKLAHGHFTLRWALSDNLRHQLLMRYDLADLPRPALVDWLLADVWRYRTAAMLNLISQVAPIFAVIFVRRPLVRAAAGGFFVIETLALGFVTALWNLFWLPLVVVFVDWEWLLRTREPAEAPPPPPPRARRVFVLAFVVYDVLTAFIPTLDQTLNTYPFSGFPMFAVIRAREPYDEHLPYSVAADHYEVLAAQPAPPDVQRWFDHTHRRLVDAVRTPTKLEKPLASLLADARTRYPALGISGVRHWLTFFEAPAYPAPARFEPHPIAVTAEIRDGQFRSVIGAMTADGVDLHPVGVDTANARLLVYRDDDPTPHELPATRTGDHFATGPIDGDLVYVVAVIGDTPWLAASRRNWKWE